MTNYSPLQEAANETGEPVTVDDMVEVGYDDYEADGRIIEIQTQILSALDALDGQTFSDPAKWEAVNALVGALDATDQMWNIETQVSFEGRHLRVELESDEGGD